MFIYQFFHSKIKKVSRMVLTIFIKNIGIIIPLSPYTIIFLRALVCFSWMLTPLIARGIKIIIIITFTISKLKIALCGVENVTTPYLLLENNPLEKIDGIIIKNLDISVAIEKVVIDPRVIDIRRPIFIISAILEGSESKSMKLDTSWAL